MTENIQTKEEKPRVISGDHLYNLLESDFADNLKVEIVGNGDLIRVPEGWHGAGKTGDAWVLFGETLKELGGTELPAENFTNFLSDKGFEFGIEEGNLSYMEASSLMESNEKFKADRPLVLSRSSETGEVPVEFQIFSGSTNSVVKILSRIGNLREVLGDIEKRAYRNSIKLLLEPFLAFSLDETKLKMGLDPEMLELRRLDDCAAGLTTVAGDMILESALRKDKRPYMDVVDVAVGTTQAMVLALFLAEKNERPLVMRVGAPTFGLAGGDDLNYMVNTQEEMLGLGRFTTGDIGDIISNGWEKFKRPVVEFHGRDDMNETRIFLNGGGPILEMFHDSLKEKGGQYEGVVSVRRGSRIEGPGDWGVIFNGVTPATRELRHFGIAKMAVSRI